MTELSLHTEVKYSSDVLDAAFFSIVFKREFRHFRYLNYPGDSVDISTAIRSYTTGKNKLSHDGLWVTADYAIMACVYSGEIRTTIAGVSPHAVEKAVTFVRTVAPETEVKNDGTINVCFHSLSDNGPVRRLRSLEVPRWADVQDNYNESTYLELASLIDPDFRPTKAGQLLLWHGPPGTGKTTALRALAYEWRDWCEIHFITDPEQLFGAKANYMMSVMVDGQEDNDKWRLLVLEDCGELLAKDARAQLMNPQALSRFLNTVDGLLGQGLKVMVLVTTNEDLGKLHDAVTRPGRCLSQIEFLNLEPSRVEKWASEHGIIVPPKSASLAELFAIKENWTNKTGQTSSKKVGFGV